MGPTAGPRWAKRLKRRLERVFPLGAQRPRPRQPALGVSQHWAKAGKRALNLREPFFRWWRLPSPLPPSSPAFGIGWHPHSWEDAQPGTQKALEQVWTSAGPDGWFLSTCGSLGSSRLPWELHCLLPPGLALRATQHCYDKF